MSQQNLSDQLELLGVYVCRGSVSRIEDKSRTVTDIELYAISKVLDININELIETKHEDNEDNNISLTNIDFKVKITSINGVNIRSGASTSYKILGAVPYGCEVRISRQTSGGGYSWGLTTYNGIKGWIALDFTKRVGTSGIKVGSTVRVKSGALVYGTNTPLSSWVYDKSFTVMELNGSRAVIGIDGNVTAAVNKDELIII